MTCFYRNFLGGNRITSYLHLRDFKNINAEFHHILLTLEFHGNVFECCKRTAKTLSE